MVGNFYKLLRYQRRALAARAHAQKLNCVGLEFDQFGRQLGRKLLWTDTRAAVRLLLTPVSCVRYFEFSFAKQFLPERAKHCLDVASPRLFSFYTACQSQDTAKHIEMLNPDLDDVRETNRLVAKLKIPRLQTRAAAVDVLDKAPPTYDCIWSLSVIEHIHGDYDDREAVSWMYSALKPGGRLLLTFPVTRRHQDEYRQHDYYGTQAPNARGEFFFQRLYDLSSVRQRLIAQLGVEPIATRWFGEVVPGRFQQYEQRWVREGIRCTVEDPREIADHWRDYADWHEMPGMGVCGLVFEKK